MSGFRLQSKSIFLTFPQCDYPLNEFRDSIEKYFGSNLEKGVVSQEKHKDGNFHLHAAICLAQPVNSRDPKLFDKLVEPPKHPNIQGRFTGGMLKAFDYVMKEGNYLPLNEKSFDLKEFCELSKKRKNSRAALIVKEFEEAPPEVVMENNKDFMLLHGKHMQAYVAWRQKVERRSKFVKALTQKVYVVPAPGYYTPWNVEIASWLTTNIRQPRKKRQKQLWIQGEGGIGKTTMREMIEEWYSLSVYLWPRDEKWWDSYGDGEYDIIILDEFRSQKMITELNPILSGDSIELSRRGQAPVIKKDNLPVIILSNHSPEECFPNASEAGSRGEAGFRALLDRLTVVKCDGPIRIVQGRPPEEILDDHFPDLPPAPPGSSMILSNDYEDIFPFSPPEYEIIDDDFNMEPPIPPTKSSCNECNDSGKECGSSDGVCRCICHGGKDRWSLEELGRSATRVAMRESAAAVPYTSADFDRNNDPFYFDKVSRASRAAYLAARNI